MSHIVRPRAQELALITAIIALAAYVGAKLNLFSNNFTPDKNSVLGDFTPCVYTGYAAIAVTWSTPFYDQTDTPVSTIGEKLFVQTGATPDVAYGVYLTDAAGAVLLWSARFDAPPFNFAVSGDALPVTAQMGVHDGVVSISVGP